jgi:hypothetical protein
MKRQQGGLGCAVMAVLVTLVVIWILFQSTLSVITIHVPVALPSPVMQPVHPVSHPAKR